MTRSWLMPALLAGLAALLVAMVGGTITDLGPWHQSLRQPSWSPPNWLYGVVWTVIFALAALSAVTAWRSIRSQRAAEWTMGLFALNGFLNILWSFLFFRAHRPDWALAELCLLWLSVLVLIVLCWRHSRTAALLLIPYLAWVSIAGALNWEVVRLNAPFG